MPDKREMELQKLKDKFVERFRNMMQQEGGTSSSTNDELADELWKVFVGVVMGERGMSKDGREVFADNQIPTQIVGGRPMRQNAMTNPHHYSIQPTHGQPAKGPLEKYETKMSEMFNLLTASLKGLSMQQFNRYNKFAFWQGLGAKEVATKSLASGILALESSNIGCLFDDLGSIKKGKPDDWDPELWTELSRAYASMVIHSVFLRPHDKVEIHVFCGTDFKNPSYNIWNTVENSTLRVVCERFRKSQTDLDRLVTYRAVAGKGASVDWSKNHGGIPGTWNEAKTPMEIVTYQETQASLQTSA
ncbi:MAG: hypothetical protein KDB03_03580 [Planctomycetales bacterium]|nr:hypothetical protein [Planctomycetales bacterium]